MTARAPGDAPPGLSAHLWEAAQRDVRGAVPDRLAGDPDTGADAPPLVRDFARLAGRAAAALGVAVALGDPGARPAGSASSARPAEDGPHEDWLSVEMHQDVVRGDGDGHLDVFGYLVVEDSTGQRHVFTEHHDRRVRPVPALDPADPPVPPHSI